MSERKNKRLVFRRVRIDHPPERPSPPPLPPPSASPHPSAPIVVVKRGTDRLNNLATSINSNTSVTTSFLSSPDSGSVSSRRSGESTPRDSNRISGLSSLTPGNQSSRNSSDSNTGNTSLNLTETVTKRLSNETAGNRLSTDSASSRLLDAGTQTTLQRPGRRTPKSLTPRGSTPRSIGGELDSDGAEWDSDRETDAANALELGTWLGQLATLSKELDGVRSSPSASPARRMESGGPAVRSRPPKPVPPPKPQLDAVRYSMANLENSPDTDLDALLGELAAFEDQLSMEGPNSLFGDWGPATSSNPGPPAPPKPAHPSAGLLTVDTLQLRSKTTTMPAPVSGQTVTVLRPGSPDAESGFCETSSLLSGESGALSGNGAPRSRDSGGSGEASSVHTPSPTQHMSNGHSPKDAKNLSPEEAAAKAKAEKIKAALEKMKEASIKKMYVKFFARDGTSKSLLVDERWTVSDVQAHLAVKHQLPSIEANPLHLAIVEHHPELLMERVYEDHEHLVENILMWTRESQNKLYFEPRALDKYELLTEPQQYLLGESSPERLKPMGAERKAGLVTEFFAESGVVQPPEVEGILWLKADGKKAWKRHWAVVRASGLYAAKGKTRSAKELQRLMSLDQAQIYASVGWKKKYKAPNDFGFALKHPQIQLKCSKYIKYFCAEDEPSWKRWIAALRIAKNGRQLYDNYVGACEGLSLPIAVQDDSDQPERGHAALLRDSVVIRPRSAAPEDASDVQLRPKSADIRAKAPQRNSRNLIQVELPSVPVDEVDHGTVRLNSTGSTTGLPHLHSTPSHLSGSIGGQSGASTCSGDAFFADAAPSGTIKRAPFPNGRLSVDSTGQTGGCMSSSSGSQHRLGLADSDSDEELPPPPPPEALASPPPPPAPTSPVYQTPSNLPLPANGGPATPRKLPPAPPPRSDATRLSINAKSPAPPPKPPKPSPTPPAAPEGDFQNELQRAMARRLRQIDGACEVKESAPPGPRKQPPPPPPKRVVS